MFYAAMRLLARASCATALFVALAAPARAETGALAQCWSDSALRYQPGDERIRKAGAAILPPKGQVSLRPLPAGAKGGAVRRVNLPPGSRKIALTFDLCEQPHEIAGYQGELVDLLRAQKVKATFFAGGKWMLSHAERTEQLMSDPLFEIGSHAWEHRNLRVVPADVMAREIAAPQLAYRSVREGLAGKQCARPGDRTLASARAPEEIRLFRFPYGACNAESLAAVAERGLTAVQWDVSAGDPWRGMSGPMMVKSVLASVRPGSIVIFHANGRGWHTQEALPEIIARLKAKGFEFVTVSELLAAGTPVSADRCYDARPGDTDRYDMVGAGGAKRVAKKAGPPDPFGGGTQGRPPISWKPMTEPN